MSDIIVGTEIISEPGSSITITEIQLTPEATAGLTIGARIPVPIERIISTWYNEVYYVQCTCGMPGCALRVAWDSEINDGVWVSMQTQPKDLWERIKCAWKVLFGGNAHWCETLLRVEECKKFVNALEKNERYLNG